MQKWKIQSGLATDINIKKWNKMKIKLFIAFLFLILTISVSSFFLYNNREQSTEENIKRVENFTENIVKQSQNENVLIWDRENITTEWNYYTGFMMYALLKTTLYNDFVEKYYNDNILPNGNVRFYKKGELDSVLPALNLYYIDKKNISQLLITYINNFYHNRKLQNWEIIMLIKQIITHGYCFQLQQTEHL